MILGIAFSFVTDTQLQVHATLEQINSVHVSFAFDYGGPVNRAMFNMNVYTDELDGHVYQLLEPGGSIVFESIERVLEGM